MPLPVECGTQAGWTFAVCAAKGMRGSMEDVTVTQELLAVLDGHGGRECVDFIASRVGLMAQLSGEQWPEAFAELDDAFRAQRLPSGSTCCLAVLRTSEDIVEIANLGDSRAVLVRAGVVIGATADHKPSSDTERARIMRSGGTVQEAADGPARIHGVAVSRAFGTYLSPFGRKELKDPSLPHADRLVSCVPEIYCWSVQPGDVLVLACDGVWDVVETSEVVSFEGDVRERVRGICSRALKTSTDNVTCIVAQLGAPMPEPEQTEPSQLDIMAAARADRPGFNRVSRPEQLEIGHELDYGEVLIKMMQGHETNLVSKNLWLGTAGDACHLPFLEFAQVTKVVNCAAEIERPDIPGVDSFWLKWCDSEEQGKAEQKSGFKRLRAATQFIQSTLESDRAVLVHCVQGVSRSACVVVALLMEWRCMEMDEAVAKVRQNHPGALKPFRFQEMLRAFQHFLRTQ